MELKERIQRGRERQKLKEPLPETVLAVVAGIVKKFDLESVPGEGGEAGGGLAGEAPEERLSLFPLVSAEQWRLTREIVARFDNPYLVFARSPEDISLSRRLYQRNPHLTAAELRAEGLGVLWARNELTR